MLAAEDSRPSPRARLWMRAWLLVLMLCLLGDSTRALLCAVHDEGLPTAQVMNQPVAEAPRPGQQDCLYCFECAHGGSCCAASPAVVSRTASVLATAHTQAIVPRWRIRSLLAERFALEFLRPPIAG